MQTSLTEYRTLGRSGLAVSPLALGAMTFGAKRWGTSEEGSREVLDAYVENGGNFIDTADVYSGGRSEEWLGKYIAERHLRDQIVIATKAGFSAGKGPHMGGNGAKHVRSALDSSLRRLNTDHVDLYWVHVWDGVTPAEELLETMSATVRSGKVRYWGISNAPAWYVSKLATLAAVRGAPGPIALQYFYSLVNRDIEDEHVALAAEFGMGIVPWSPLAYGLLSGKYDRRTVGSAAPQAGSSPAESNAATVGRQGDDKRLDGSNPFGDTLFTDRNWTIVDTLVRIAQEVGQPPARVALAWLMGRPGVVSILMGASRTEQLKENMGSLGVSLSPEHRAALDAVSTPEPRLLYGLFTPGLRKSAIFGGSNVHSS